MSVLRLLRVHWGSAAVPAVLVLTAALLLGGLPRIFEAAFDRSARDVLAEMPAQVADLTVTFRPDSPGDHLDSADRFAALDRRWRAALPPGLAAAADGPRQERLGAHYGARTYDTPVSGRLGPGHQGDQYVNLAWLSGADRRVRYVEGSAPGPPRTVPAPRGHPEASHVTRFDIGLAASAAEEMDLPVGTVLLLGNSDVVEARVTGLFEPVDPRDRYWRIDDNVLTIRRRITPGGVEKHITALIDPAGLASLRGHSRDLRYAWTLVADPAAVTSRAAPDLIRDIGRFRDRITAATPAPGAGTSSHYVLDTGLDRLLAGFRVRLASAQALMYLTLAALAGVALGVIALAVRLLTGRMRGALGLARARGASLARVTATGTGCVALATAPAALLGHGLAYLVPGPATLAARLGPPLIAVATALLAAGLLAAAHRRPPTERRADVTARRPSPRRTAAEALIVLLAFGGVQLLRTRGLTTGPNPGLNAAGGYGVDPAEAPLGADPLLVLVPALVTIAAALIVVRCHPHVLRLLVRLAGRRPSAVPFLGLTMAARSGAAAALPALILLPALAVSVFGAVVTGALGDAQRLTAWRETGADARVEWEAELPAALIARVRGTPGVRAVVPAVKDTVQLGYGGRTATIVAIDLAAYRRILAGTPLSAPAPPAEVPEGGAQAVPALVSPGLAGPRTIDIGWHKRMTVVPRGVVKGGLPGVAPGTGPLIVVPYDTLERAGLRQYATMLLVQGDRPGGVDRQRLRAAVDVPQILVTTVGATLRDITGAPLAGAVELALRVVTAALAAYAVTAVLLTLVAGAAARGAAVTLLRTLGLSERQARTLTVLEIAPLIVLTAVAGLALGLALPAVLGPGLDLSPYIGPAQQAQGIGDHPLDPTTPVLLAAGLTAAALLGAFAHAAAARRRPLGDALRDGEIGDIT